MAEIMGNWPSGHGQITKIWPSDRCGGKTIPAAMPFGYNLREFGGYLGNVGPKAKNQKDWRKDYQQREGHRLRW